MVCALLSFGLGCSDDTTGSSGSDTAWTVTKDASTLTVLEDPVSLLTISIDPAAEGSVTVAIADEADEIVVDPDTCTLSAATGVTSCTVSGAAPLSTAIGDHYVSVWALTSGSSPTPTWRDTVDVVDFGLTNDLASLNLENSSPCLPNPFITQRMVPFVTGDDTCEFLRSRCSNTDWTSVSCSNGQTYCNAGDPPIKIQENLTCSYNWPETSGKFYGLKFPNFTCSLSGTTDEFQYIGVAGPPNPPSPDWASPGFSPPRPFCQPYYEPCATGMVEGLTLNCTVAPDTSVGTPSIISVNLNLSGPPITNAGGLVGWENAELTGFTSTYPICPSNTVPFAGDTSYGCVCVNNQTTNPTTGAVMPTMSFQVPWIQAIGSQSCLTP